MPLRVEQAELREALTAVCDLVHREGGTALVVGGSVRDSLLGVPAKDLDVEVYGVAPDLLKRRLAARFQMGRHLIELGLKPGPAFKPILDACYEAQLDEKNHVCGGGDKDGRQPSTPHSTDAIIWDQQTPDRIGRLLEK